MQLFLKWKIWRIETNLKSLLKDLGIKPQVWSFGAYDIDPKYLVFVVGVTTDSEKIKLKTDLDFNEKMKDLLIKYNWPNIARESVIFDIESQETVSRETDGHWWHHYK
jgi:hypothetical protein